MGVELLLVVVVALASFTNVAVGVGVLMTAGITGREKDNHSMVMICMSVFCPRHCCWSPI